MGKNIKQIIHVSCLVSLLFTCNKTIGKNGTTQAIIPYLHLDENDTTQTIAPYAHFDESDTIQAIVPYFHYSTEFCIEAASIKLDKLIHQQKEKHKIDLPTYNEVKQILSSYKNESIISILDEKNNQIGICDTRGWQASKDIEEEVKYVKQKLIMLEKLNKNYTDEATFPCYSMTVPIQEAFLDVSELIQQQQNGEKISRHTYNKIKKTLHAYNKELRIHIKNRKDGTLMGICYTEGWHEDEDIKKKMADVKHKLALLAIPNLKLDESESSIKKHKILEVAKKK